MAASLPGIAGGRSQCYRSADSLNTERRGGLNQCVALGRCVPSSIGCLYNLFRLSLLMLKRYKDFRNASRHAAPIPHAKPKAYLIVQVFILLVQKKMIL